MTLGSDQFRFELALFCRLLSSAQIRRDVRRIGPANFFDAGIGLFIARALLVFAGPIDAAVRTTAAGGR